ncbi:hypothetical protein Nepgr_002200 [Nepenthes gracilis]|uniref:Uncharacterized protein n=1 Tax=Nepenthes gracilis TaxID=150966 RepID=A0AAD3P6G1_NEPGR|nr:hypothetical protein Nepgr_002200 [Nepenthes gracilis]
MTTEEILGPTISQDVLNMAVEKTFYPKALQSSKPNTTEQIPSSEGLTKYIVLYFHGNLCTLRQGWIEFDTRVTSHKVQFAAVPIGHGIFRRIGQYMDISLSVMSEDERGAGTCILCLPESV